ncbi:hypothetical protein SAMN04489834_1380 [Microterricola viridarii]|uniref:Uncharacterized protein n=1 Tax=Microterricola viridarii TaxID=412690 RepID=A0A1H1RR96_9MICO|nr:hypothetical protein SAMN04489834_1380 [Microterricola viridarii]
MTGGVGFGRWRSLEPTGKALARQPRPPGAPAGCARRPRPPGAPVPATVPVAAPGRAGLGGRRTIGRQLQAGFGLPIRRLPPKRMPRRTPRDGRVGFGRWRSLEPTGKAFARHPRPPGALVPAPVAVSRPRPAAPVWEAEGRSGGSFRPASASRSAVCLPIGCHGGRLVTGGVGFGRWRSLEPTGEVLTLPRANGRGPGAPSSQRERAGRSLEPTGEGRALPRADGRGSWSASRRG